jgi:putative Mg2+ transporter-C (MgtC) family protein
MSAIFMMWGSKIENLLPAKHAITVSVIFHKGVEPTAEEMNRMAERLGYSVARGSFTIAERDGRHEWRFVAVSKGKGKSGTLVDVSHYLNRVEGIESYQVAHARN